MPVAVIAGTNIADLETDFATWAAANEYARISGFTFVARDMVGIAGLEMMLAISYDTLGISLAASPFALKVFQDDSAAALGAAITDWEAGATPAVEGVALLDYLGQRRRLSDYMGAVIYNDSSAALSNWLVSQPIPRLVQVAFVDTPYDASPYETIQVDATDGIVTVVLPAVITPGLDIVIIKTDVTANVVTIDGNGNTISGDATPDLTAQYESFVIRGGTNEWLII